MNAVRARLTARTTVVGISLLLAGVGVGLYLGTVVPAAAQGPGAVPGVEGLPPGFEGMMPSTPSFPEGIFVLNDQYVYVMTGRTVYQFRHDRFPDGMRQFTFGPEMSLPPQPMGLAAPSGRQ